MPRVTLPRALRWTLIGCAATGIVVACVDLESLGNGVRPSFTGDAQSDAQAAADASAPNKRFCAPDLSAVFCDDFDDPTVAAGSLWPGIDVLYPSPVMRGDAGFAAVAFAPPSSSPNAVAFFARSVQGEPRPFALFNRAFQVGEVDGGAIALTADIRIQELVDSPDAGTADAASDDGEAPLPFPRVATLGIIAFAGTPGTAQLVFSPDAVHLVTAADSTIRRPQLAGQNYLAASQLAWIRVVVVAGTPEAVQAFAQRSGVSVSCPAIRGVAAAWVSLPPGKALCTEAASVFGDLSTNVVVATIGAALDRPTSTRVLFDSVRVDFAR